MASFDFLLCPLCDNQPLHLNAPKSFRCAAGHCFDVSKRGYVNLLPVQNKRSKSPGDSDAMVQARARFLDSQAYQAIADFLCQYITKWKAQHAPNQALSLLDAGCGEGYYLHYLAQSLAPKSCYGLDISKAAIDRASRRSKSINWLVASNRDVPLQSQCFDVLICAFGFASYDEFARLLKPGGVLLLLEAGPSHLLELRQQLYPTLKQKPLPSIEQALSCGFVLHEEQLLSKSIQIQRDQLKDLLLMTPHGHRAKAQDQARVLEQPEHKIQIEVSLRALSLDKTQR